MQHRKRRLWRPRSSLHLPQPGIVLGCALVLVTALVAYEMHTSKLQALWLSRYAGKLTWTLQEGGCEHPMPSLAGPYDARLGYQQLGRLSELLTQRDFVIARQACPTPQLLNLAAHGIAPPYGEKGAGTLRILDRDGNDLYRAALDRHHFGDFGQIPALLVGSLLYIENRQLLDDSRPQLNPALEWDRLFLASARYALDKVIDTGNVMGGSTLATQMEKFRHSPEGRTSGGGDKMKQIASASLRAYRGGQDTRKERREIILDYINSMPLGAAPGEGEITGIGQGMWAWFGKPLDRVVADLTLHEDEANLRRKAETYRQVLALVMATRRPSLYLDQRHDLLEKRIESYLPLLAQEGVITPRLAAAAGHVKLRFRREVPERPRVPFIDRKATNAVRTELLDLLQVDDLYTLDRYDLRVETSLDATVQEQVVSTFHRLAERDYLARNGFYGEHLLVGGEDPARIIYSFSLYENTLRGNRLRVHADNLNAPLDVNSNVKLELGSTAKLRTMANYLMVIAGLHQRYREQPDEALQGALRAVRDSISRWSLYWLEAHPRAGLAEMLDASLQRSFSTDPNEKFFTAGGMQTFANFDDKIQGPVSLRFAFQNSVNLVYIRLMRELEEYYLAERGYDVTAVLGDPDDAKRKDLLDASMEHEAREVLWSFYSRYRGLGFDEALRRMCGKEANGARRAAVFFLAEHPDASLEALRAEVRRLYPLPNLDALLRTHHRAYAGKVRSAQDEAYLLDRHPLEVWMVRDLRDHRGGHWGEVLERSTGARLAASEWIYRPRFKHQQDRRIRIELERRAFVEIQKAWKALGYPFESLVPSLATAIGSSADRPQALAELVGIIQNGGLRTPFLRVEALHFGEGTPYETHIEPARGPGARLMPRQVAQALKGLMLEVVEVGTARRVQGVLRDREGGAIPVGGKTGSGDNRYERFNSDGSLISSRAVSRTASFVFVIGDRFFGMVTAHVAGDNVDRYRFTSSLALQAFKALAPAIQPIVYGAELQQVRGAAPVPVGVASAPSRPEGRDPPRMPAPSWIAAASR